MQYNFSGETEISNVASAPELISGLNAQSSKSLNQRWTSKICEMCPERQIFGLEQQEQSEEGSDFSRPRVALALPGQPRGTVQCRP